MSSKLPDLFVGPLGKAQLDAIHFVTGIHQSYLLSEVISKLDTVEELLKSESLTGTERQVAEKIKEDLEESFLSLAMSFGDPQDGKKNESPVF